MRRNLFALLMMPVPLACSHAGDWPQLLGPNRNGAAVGAALAVAWPKEGPRPLWKRDVGHGFAGPAVSGNTVILHHRTGDTEVVEAMEATTGATQWKQSYATGYRDDFNFDPGPRAVPTIAEGKVFTFGADGMLLCANLKDGTKLWSVDCKKQLGSPKGFFGLACSPLVEGGHVIVNAGGKNGASLIAFNSGNGEVVWKALDDEPGYSSPVAVTIHGRRLILACTRSYFAGLDAGTGTRRFQMDFRPPVNASVTGAIPLVKDDQVFISAGYDLGARLLELTDAQPRVLWQGDEQLSLQFTSAVLRDGFLYGLHGRHDFPGGTELRCVEWKTGKVRWAKAGLGAANVLLADAELLVLTEGGQLLKVDASPSGFNVTGRAQILGSGVRAYPALANGRLFARDKSRLICLDLSPDGP